MINIETRKAYSEVLEILKYLPQAYYDRIPKLIIDVFENEKMKDYEPKIEKENIFNEKILQKQTKQVIAMLNYNYWCTDEKRKKELYNKYYNNEIKKQEELKQKYDVNKILEDRQKIDNTKETVQENIALIEYKETIVKKIFNIIKKIFFISK